MEITYSLVYNAHITAIRIAMRLFIKYLHNVPYTFLPLLLLLLLNRATYLLIFFTNILSPMVRYRPVTTNPVLDSFALVSLMNLHVSFYK